MSQKVRIIDCNGKEAVTLRVNGKMLKLANGQEVDVPDHFIDALENSGVITDPPNLSANPTTPPTEDSILDGNVSEVTAALEGLPEDDLQELLSAEQAGKTRKGVVAALNKAIEAFAE